MKKFFKGIRGKQILVSVLAVMVVVAGFYRWTMERNQTVSVTNEALPTSEQTEEIGTSEEPEDMDYFARARYERDCARSETVEILTVSAISGNEDKAVQEKLKEHEKNAEDEIAIEDMIKTKGYEDCVAFVDEQGVRVIVKAENLDAVGVSEIKDVIVAQTDAKPTEIKISNQN